MTGGGAGEAAAGRRVQHATPRKQFAGSGIGGIAETQEVLDFCAAKSITPGVEVIPIQSINGAYDRLVKGDGKYRFVIDTASLKLREK